jgi:hypothetical protein
LTVEDVLECIQERHGHPDYGESTSRLVDLSAAHGYVSFGVLNRLAKLHSLSRYRGRCAFVAPEDVQYRLGETFVTIISGDRPVAVFRSRECALRWLCEPDPELEAATQSSA